MTAVQALAMPAAGAAFETITIQRRALRDDDVRIEIAYAGICHSDIHTVREEWGPITFPLVPGHEIAGVVAEVGPAVTRVRVGDRVGVGCMVDSCGTCDACKDGQENYCRNGAVWTYGSDDVDGTTTQGGYSQQVVVAERFVARVPDGIGLDVAAPLLCAGITTYNPLKRFGAGPGTTVAVVGLGGLGHMGVKIAVAMGAEVTVMSRTRAKEADARELGASGYVATGEEGALEAVASTYDIVLNTVSADLPVQAYLETTRPRGALVNVGLPPSDFVVSPWSVVGGSRIVAGSNIGGMALTQEMLDFCAQHDIAATIETISADDVDAAYDRVVAGDVHYRAVIDVTSIGAAATTSAH
ncbi:NAD(P)-dependent alcohol dehydrogenase [Luteipulveratus sp. YIM 133132]|uniref:NAD(P)-dependent alcohol dehydrogenase n=1 Tax=Luteipulveratus flavus TaxID=3031728 RepID=UPI0023B09BFB|nr:NAD(P)-dependent alcohol dehydrogenase [Luteipulveratus sp. YIM 133132]MDE9365828.1 NAD(P)-dependent alcohol dehydrogenase [Luteipulveratus sp. YIM 133132]